LFTGATETLRFGDNWADDDNKGSGHTLYATVSYTMFDHTNQNFDVTESRATVKITAHHNIFSWSGERSPKVNGSKTSLHSYNNVIEHFQGVPMQAHNGGILLDEFSEIICDKNLVDTKDSSIRSCVTPQCGKNAEDKNQIKQFCEVKNGVGLSRSFKTPLDAVNEGPCTKSNFTWQPCKDYKYNVHALNGISGCSAKNGQCGPTCLTLGADKSLSNVLKKYAGANTWNGHCLPSFSNQTK